ncbi:outer membrane lipoprotein-sorting protein, partial [bacterium]|nr:outer membrane lipoprotein-sorting protein [bacterium]
TVKGRAMLFEGRNLWIHIPKTRRPIRISPAQRLMGESSNGDVAATNFSEDYVAALLGEETIGTTLCYHLMLKAVDRKITYHKIEYWVDKKTGKPVKSSHFAISGKLLKTAYYKAFITSEGQEKLHRLLLVNPILEGHHTLMIYNQYKKEKMEDSLFRKENLNRL